jgi:hypothetical protein
MPLVPIRINEQFQYMKLKIETPIASEPIVVTESPRCPAIIVPAIPIIGTVILEMILGKAIRNISRFILIS